MASPDDLLDAARAQTGLGDFGEDSFREGLEVLVRSLREEARLNAIGEAVIYPRLVGHLAQRLQIEDWYRRHPDIDDVPIVAPLVQLGLPRTGSTALGFLLAKDPDVRYLRQWESSEPAPPPATVEGPDPRIARAMQMSAGTKQHVPAEVHGPMECLDLMALDFKTQIYHAFARIPSYAEWVSGADLTSTYRYERRALRLLQWREPARPWRLRSPAHLLWLEALDRVFPDARFVMTHRDPTDVLLSVCDVYADISAAFTDQVDLRFIGELNVAQWSTGIERALAFRDASAHDRFYDIDFHAMQAEPIAEVRGLYAWLGEPVTDGYAASRPTGGSRTRPDASPPATPTRRRTDSTSMRSVPGSPRTSSARSSGPAMSGRTAGVKPTDDARRRYDSPVRRAQVAETRERILGAACTLVRELESWDWRPLTFRAVAERAAVGERTVYRHFATEQVLHEAVMQRLAQESGVDYEGLTLDDVSTIGSTVFASMAGFAAPSSVEVGEGVLRAEDERRRAAMVAAVEATTPTWSDDQRIRAAAALDVLWSVPSYQRLATAWMLGADDVASVIDWMIGLVVDAVRDDRGPTA